MIDSFATAYTRITTMIIIYGLLKIQLNAYIIFFVTRQPQYRPYYCLPSYRTYLYVYNITVATTLCCESAGVQRRRAVSHITRRSFVSFRRDGIIIVLYYTLKYNIMISYLFKLRNQVLKSINLNPQMKILKLENDSPNNLDCGK